MNELIVRFANKKDIEDILLLENDYGYETYSYQMIESSFEYDYYYTYVICYKNKIVGYISATIILDECNLIKIIVSKSFRKNGYGKMLFENLLIACKEKNVKNIFLEVRKDNIIAKNFYNNLGFKKTNERLNYYEDNCDAEIFRYTLND